jgi:hypothetical protein
MAPKPLVLLSVGVEGGIAPRPVPLQLVVLPEGNATRLYVVRRDLDDRKATYTQGRGPSFAALQKELAGLYNLPQEPQTGLADPYGMKVALHSHDGDRCWINDPPNGCVRGPQTVTPSAAQKTEFATVVGRLETLAEAAQEPLSEKEYQTVFAELFPPSRQ